MSVHDIAKFGKLLAQFLASFACCFTRPQGRALLGVYVRGLLSNVPRKNAEAIALDQQLSPQEEVQSGELVTMEQVRRAANVFVASIGLPPCCRDELYQQEARRQTYYARRNAQAATSHRKTRRKRLKELGIDPDKIKSVPPKPPS